MDLEVGWWSVSPSDLPGSASHSAGNIGTHTAMPSFSVGAEDLNSTPHDCVMSAFLTRLCPPCRTPLNVQGVHPIVCFPWEHLETELRTAALVWGSQERVELGGERSLSHP